jgi:N-methylhydantoinase A
MSNKKNVRLAVDIGGTFTDVVLASATGQFSTKLLTTHQAPAEAVLSAISQLLEQSQTQPGDVETIIHGTTLAANTIIERKGARTALLVTQGHRDALESGYENRFDQYDLAIAKPPPIVARRFRWPVHERMSASGDVLLELDEACIIDIVKKIQQNNIESVAIGFLHSYANPAHEQIVAKLLLRALPDLKISLSSDVSPQIREYDRISTTVANAYVQPLMAGYINELEKRLGDFDLNCPLLLVMSTGGLTTPDIAKKFPIRLVESGPAGGAILAASISKQTDISEVISFDMGGTTAKLCLIDKGTPQRTNAFEIDRLYRFIRGSGLPLNIPSIEMVEIGAGGGSIAAIDELQRLRVGPRSAGSVPGPACYKRGGTQPTVTDADLLLGYINTSEFAGGEVTLSPTDSEKAIIEHIAEKLDINSYQAAAGINEVVDEAMANATRVHAVESGQDITNRTLIAFGGAAPLHAARLAEKLGISKIIIPHQAGVGSAVGFLLAPISFEISRSWVVKINNMETKVVTQLVDDMQAEATHLVRKSIVHENLQVSMKATLRYSGQGHEVETDICREQLLNPAELVLVFEERYRQLYGRLIAGVDVEIVTLIVLISESRESDVQDNSSPQEEEILASETRNIFINHNEEPINVPCYTRNSFKPGNYFSGPALIQEAQTTTIVPENMQVKIDNYLHIIMERQDNE